MKVIEVPALGRYSYAVHNGFHRFYASVAVGFTHPPARVFQPEILAVI